MIEELKTNIVRVIFTKKNGEQREMLCTLKDDIIPAVSGASVPNDEVTTVYDIEAQGWRSFRNNSVIDYSVVGKG